MAFSKEELRDIITAYKAGLFAFLVAISIGIIVIWVEAFLPHGHSTVTNTTKTDPPQSSFLVSSSLVDFTSTAMASTDIKATLIRRGDEDRGDGEMKSLHFDAFSHPSEMPSRISVTSIDLTGIASSSLTAGLPAAATFKTTFTAIMTSEALTSLPITYRDPLIMDSVFSTGSDSDFGIAAYNPSSSSMGPTNKHAGTITAEVHGKTELAAPTASSAIFSTTSDLQDGVRPNGKTRFPIQEGTSLPTGYNPFATTAIAPSGSLTALASALSFTPTQGVPSAPLSSIVAAVSSSAVVAVSSITTSPSLTSLSTQISTSQPTSWPTLLPSTPLAAPSSNSKLKLKISLGVCIPILVAIIIFIAVWQYIRWREKKRADDLEKDITWVTPRPSTATSSLTEKSTHRKVRAKRPKSAGNTLPSFACPNPALLGELNEVERAVWEANKHKYAGVDARTATATLSSARSPRKEVQRRSGGPSMRQGLDGANDSPLRRRASQIFTHHQDILLNPFSDAYEIGLAEIGLAVSPPDEINNDCIRKALACYQPTRLSTITDKSGETDAA